MNADWRVGGESMWVGGHVDGSHWFEKYAGVLWKFLRFHCTISPPNPPISKSLKIRLHFLIWSRLNGPPIPLSLSSLCYYWFTCQSRDRVRVLHVTSGSEFRIVNFRNFLIESGPDFTHLTMLRCKDVGYA